MPVIRCVEQTIAGRIGRISSFVRRNATTTQQSHSDSAESNAFVHRRASGGTIHTPMTRDQGIHAKSIAVKDNICTVGMPTTCASAILRHYESPFDATVVEILKDAGTLIDAKTNMDEFGMGSHSLNSCFGPVKSKGLDQKYNISSGGSSGGSAVAVAEAIFEVALGTDTGGSIRLPAAYTGVYGFKPSYGRLSRWGVVAYANSLDTVAILSRSSTLMRNTYHSLDVYDPKDPTSLSPATRKRITDLHKNMNAWREVWRIPRGKNIPKREKKRRRVGVPIEYNIAELAPEVRAAWIEVLHNLQQLGHEIVPVSLPTTRQALSAYYVIAPAEAASNLAKYDGVRFGSRSAGLDAEDGVLFSKTRGDGFGSEAKRRILLGSYTLSADAVENYFIQAQKVRRLVQQDFDRVFIHPNPLRNVEFDMTNEQGVDILICPTAPTFAPSVAEVETLDPVQTYLNDVFTVPASLAGLPALTIPIATKSQHGKTSPIGIQIIGQFGSDLFVFRILKLLEQNFASEKFELGLISDLPTVKRSNTGKKVGEIEGRERT